MFATFVRIMIFFIFEKINKSGNGMKKHDFKAKN